jgi:hypothetical protein
MQEKSGRRQQNTGYYPHSTKAVPKNAFLCNKIL